ncbi:Asp23/Gls24 family envelope stress response protein [Nocardiopsis alkaliphila]|uniref:Asp23/Gls24 family envelope stress response protein n=1 Tax=Nocardiopsis alkaliphila TaxID=225762 RepID=UPI0004781A13|nr:Asp23/Gls24 family envelope stress response protein [Nocardiopsis alkaliphila]
MVGVRGGTVPRGTVPGPREEAGARHVRARDPGGRVDIPGSVIGKVVTESADEVPGVRTVRFRAARVRVSGEVVLLRLRIEVDYPRSVRRAAEEVREHVKSRVEWITGKRVHHIDIEITELMR